MENRLTELEERVDIIENDAAAAQEDAMALEGRVEVLEQSANGLAVFDVNDVKIGEVIGFEFVTGINPRLGGVLVTPRISGQTILLMLTGFTIDGVQSELVFQSNNCSGTPYMRIGTPLWPQNAVIGSNNTLYVPEDGIAPENLTIQSFIVRDGNCTSIQDPIDYRHLTVVPAVSLVDLNTLFTAPFEVRE